MAARTKDKRRSLSSLFISTTTTSSSSSVLSYYVKHPLSILLLFSLWLYLLFLCFPTTTTIPPQPSSAPLPTADVCDPDIAPFYIYDLPDRFNRALLRRCRSLSVYTDMCPHISHRGLGLPLPSSPSSWHATHQFLAEMVFHARAERHPCRVSDPSSARLFYIPFYAGLYASSHFRQSNLTLRDALANDLLSHLSTLPSFLRCGGRDHFLTIGRTAWDFMREDDNSTLDFGANRLLLLPEAANIAILTVERHPWRGGPNQYGIPYPSYFHPHTEAEMAAWQYRVLRSNRTHLFAFIGGPRPGLEKAAARAEILRQCGASPRCLRVECEPGSAACHDPSRVLDVMRGAEFCLQPPGDSYTRRSVFDAVLAGCVPVFFSEHTAYTQYAWYAPARPEDWSVLIAPDRLGRIEEVLGRVPRAELERMRARVVDMIPSVTYAHPNSSRSELGFPDAVDVALAGLTERLGPMVTSE